MEDRSFEILKDLGMIEIHEFSSNDSLVQDSHNGHSSDLEKHRDLVQEEENIADKDVSPNATIPPEATVQTKSPSITATRSSRTSYIVVSPKVEAKRAAKYGAMTLEDRAFEILKDLGMIEIHDSIVTKQEQQNRVEIVDSRNHDIAEKSVGSDADEVLSTTKASPTATPGQKKERISRRERFLRPIKKAFENSKNRLLGHSDSLDNSALCETSSLSDDVARALQQPKSPTEEAQLAKMYGQLSLEDRAYAILCDLGMIESN